MRIRNLIIASGLTLACTGSALGAVSADKAAQLGKNLTLVGAEKAGNKEGTIPEYTGGITTPPAKFKKGDGWRPDPYEGEKPLYSITAKNMAQYNDKLSEGVKAMLKKYPATFRLDVYKTHRSAAFPKYVLDNTVKHATTAKTSSDGLSLSGAHAGFPFPIPQNGYEAMWNHLLHFNGLTNEARFRDYTVDSSGRPTLQSEGSVNQEFQYYDQSKPDAKDYYSLKLRFEGPARRVGEAVLLIDPVDYSKNSRKAWQYLPGQRRTKLAPDLAFDTPSPLFGGTTTWDDLFLFSGSMERYDFKIVGKKEMYIPYNDYKMIYWNDHAKELLKPNNMNPDLVRWELHRVWVVEGTLKPGKRHLYSKRTYYLDEDCWVAALSDEYDGRGQLYRVGMTYITPSYEVPCPLQDIFAIYDLVANTYAVNALPVKGEKGILYPGKTYSPKEWTADSLASGGIR